ncbi:hypothetical protein [Streptomyces flavofungini]|uniref:hypothetical protein n=1 Tax=Streptomyces flavofungini TaxID=68200 RepID=UPI0025B15DBF|nr:hypothetical protein [Streptomyces flavofungini]WJV48977.1 hypothetical protein QUY26_27755 [Streptomyces flavofungini]
MVLLVAGYAIVASGIGASPPEGARDAETFEDSVLMFVGLLAAGGFRVAALLRFWRTAFTHVILVGTAFLVGLAFLKAQQEPCGTSPLDVRFAQPPACPRRAPTPVPAPAPAWAWAAGQPPTRGLSGETWA